MLYWQSPQEPIENKRLIFDEVYRNQLEKEMLDGSDQFFYFKTLGKIRDRFRIKSGSVVEGLFESSSQIRKVQSRAISRPKGLTMSTSFGVEKIHNKMFKIHKPNAYPKNKSKDDGGSKESARGALHSQQLEFRSEFPHELYSSTRPRLTDIVNRHRKMQRHYHERKQEQRSQSFDINNFDGLKVRSWIAVAKK